jgi:hypothetical protein
MYCHSCFMFHMAFVLLLSSYFLGHECVTLKTNKDSIFLTCIREVNHSNLSWRSGVLTETLSLVLLGKQWDITVKFLCLSKG